MNFVRLYVYCRGVGNEYVCCVLVLVLVRSALHGFDVCVFQMFFFDRNELDDE